ncbi:MAG: stage III sporulation protein AE [Dorea sp.]|nr:stage III sporulation protein AE [Dorea sp.]MDY2812691.1 stage III sporulation protein AE [Dorea sp.]
MKKRKRIICFVIRLLMLMLTWEIISSMTPVQVCRASDPQEKEMSVMEEGLIDQLEMDEINGSLAELFPEEKLEFKEVLLGVISGDLNFSADLLNRLVMDQISYAFRVSKENLVHILLITVIAAVLHNFSTIFQNRQISEISFYVVYMLLIALTLNSFEVVIDWVSEGVENMTSFMGVFCPLYFLAVSIAKGSVTAVAFYQLVLFLIYLVEILISKILLPIIHVYMMVRVLNFLSAEEYLSKCAELIEMIVNWSLKSLLACIVGLNLIQGMISPAIDTVKRSTLTRSAEAIPGIGDAIGGMTEVVLGTAVLVKNGIGVTGALICIALCVGPLVQIGCITLLYKLAAAVIQPVSDKRIVGCVETMGEGCRLLMRLVFTTGMLFLLTVAIVAAVTGNV